MQQHNAKQNPLPSGMGSVKCSYKNIKLQSEKGLKEVERLRKAGWKIVSVGFCTVQLEKGCKK